MGRLSYREYLKENRLPHHWCPGCGNGVVLQALLRAFSELEIPRNQIVLVSGIGCWGGADRYALVNAFHGTHGRALAFATGIKICNPSLYVVALLGDGDGATIGGNHLIHAARRNVGITTVLVNNYNYGMTGGQYSATTPSRARSSTSPYGNPERPFDLCKLVEAAGAPFVARASVCYPAHLKNLIVAALKKKGMSFVEVSSICPTEYGRLNKSGDAVTMLKELANEMKPRGRVCSDEERANGLGIFVDKEIEDFSSVYKRIQDKAMLEAQGENEAC